MLLLVNDRRLMGGHTNGRPRERRRLERPSAVVVSSTVVLLVTTALHVFGIEESARSGSRQPIA